MRRARIAFAFVFAAAAFVFFAQHGAHAKTEYCPASIEATQQFGAPNTTLYSFVLSAQSARAVQGTLIVQTNAGWFLVDFPKTELVPFEERFHNSNASWKHEAYFSKTLYVEFPAAVTSTSRWSVLEAQSTGDTVLNWDARGAVTCKFVASGLPSLEQETHFTSAIADVPPPYDLSKLPAPPDVIIDPAAAKVDPGVTCSQPFDAAVATRKVSPTWPAGIGAPFHDVTVVVVVAVSHDGRADDAWLLVPTGTQQFDGMAVAAAANSTYRAARVFCSPAPGYYIYVVTYVRGSIP